jgi:hypothetical protein
MPGFEGGGRTPQEWRVLIKRVACYADGLGQRLYGADLEYRHSGTQVAALTLDFVREARKGYAFRDGHVLYYDFLCQACLRTAQALQRASVEPATAIEQCLADAEDDTPLELTEGAAVGSLERRTSLEAFLVFVRAKKLKGKLRGYSLGFAKYAADGWDAEAIARDLRMTEAAVGKCRAQLREFLEEFEIEEERRGRQMKAS